PKVESEARAALAADPNLAEAHASLASVTYLYHWDWAGAEREFRKAIQLKPAYATAHHWYFLFLTFSGRPEEGWVEIRQAQELDPLSLPISTDLGQAYYYGRRYKEALEQCRKTLEFDPTFVRAHFWLAES